MGAIEEARRGVAGSRSLGRALAAARLGLAALVLAGLLLPARAAAQSPAAPAWITDGPVYAIARTAERTYIGGDFTWLARRSGSALAYAKDSGQRIPSFPEAIGGDVLAIAPDGRGGYYLGGEFRSVGGLLRDRLAHVLVSGAVDPDFEAGANAAVRALRYVTSGPDAGTLYVGGDFTQIGSQPRSYLAAIDAVDRVTSWAPAPSGPVRALFPLSLPLTITLYIGKASPEYPEVQTPLIIAGGNAGLQAFWGPGAVAGSDTGTPIPIAGQSAASLALSGQLGALAAGEPKETTHETTPTNLDDPLTQRRHFALYHGLGSAGAIGAARLTVEQGPNSTRGQIAVTLTGGSAAFTAWAPQATCDNDTTACPTAPAGQPKVRALALQGSSLYIAGELTKLTHPGQPNLTRQNIARLDAIKDPAPYPKPADQTSPAPDPKDQNPAYNSQNAFNPTANHPVRALHLDGQTLYAAGEFSAAGGQPRERLAALDTTKNTQSATAFAPSPTPGPGPGNAVAPIGDAVLLGGGFQSVGDPIPRARLAAFDAQGELAPFAPAADGAVRALSLSPDGQRLYAAGLFTQIGGASRAGLAALRVSDGQALAGFDPRPNGGVLALAQAPGGQTLYAGGAFTQIAGSPRPYLAALDPTTGAPLGFDSGANATVRALAPSCEGTLYAGGSFTRIGGAERERLAALDPVSGAASAWNPGANGAVLALATSVERVYAGGSFTEVAGLSRRRLVALDRRTGEAIRGFDPAPDAAVRALSLAADERTLFAGGDFYRIADAPQSYVAALDTADGRSTAWTPHVTRPVAATDTALFGGGSAEPLDGPPEGFAVLTPAASPPPSCERPAPAPAPAVGGAIGPPSAATLPPPPLAALGAAADTKAPRLRILALAAKRATRGGGARLTLRLFLSEPASIRVAVERRLGEAARRCPRAARRPSSAGRCPRYRRLGALTRAVGAGRSTLRLARIGRHRFASGRYRVKVTATDRAGNRAKPATLYFKVGGR